jgi:perosamine synthetase
MLLSSSIFVGNELKYVTECLETGWVSSAGKYVSMFEESLANYTGSKYAIATVNGSAALHISLILAGVKRNDYVLVPNLTFVASVNTISYTGAEPILIDVDKNTWQWDIDLLEQFLENNTTVNVDGCFYTKNGRKISALMPVHILGNMCDMDRICIISKKYNIPIVEDSTEALGSFYKGKHSGTFGLFGTCSFNGNKMISTGGGGMILTDDEVLAKKAKHLTTQAKAKKDEYFHDETAYNYRLVNVLAAIGVGQMEQINKFLSRKKEIDTFYKSHLSKLEGVVFQKHGKDVEPNNWLFTFRLKEKEKTLTYLNSKGLESRPFWVPMNRLPMYEDKIYIQNNDVAGTIYNSCISIPCSPFLKNEDLQTVVDAILEVNK